MEIAKAIQEVSSFCIKKKFSFEFFPFYMGIVIYLSPLKYKKFLYVKVVPEENYLQILNRDLKVVHTVYILEDTDLENLLDLVLLERDYDRSF